MSSQCRSCPAEVLWATTVPRGAKVPLDPTPVQPGTRGALACVKGDRELFAYGLKTLAERIANKEQIPAEEARQAALDRYEWRTSHFSTCPNAGQHRKGNSE